MYQERLRSARPARTPPLPRDAAGRSWPLISRPHAAVEIAGQDSATVWRCVRCREALGSTRESYKLGALLRVTRIDDVVDFPFPGGDGYLGKLLEYFCPGCGASLQVDIYCPGFDDEMVFTDLQLELG
jgi:acetone carboxylase gamma subunit